MGRPRKNLPHLEQLAANGRQRLFTRKSVATEVWLEDELGEPLLALPAEDISVGGLLLRAALPLRVGARLFLSIPLPSQSLPIRLVGEVVRRVVVKEKGAVPAIGVRFIEVDPTQRAALQRWVSC